jgi:hypothetical protein
MNKENFDYMKNKVTKYDQLEGFKIDLNDFQESLLRDADIKLNVKDYDECIDAVIADEQMRKQPNSHIQDIYGDLLREVKDDLIDTIGMTIVKINEIMEEM